MSRPPAALPAEVWIHVFGYLSAADKFSVRGSCKYFRKLVDHSSLWADWPVYLSFRSGPYNSGLWLSLRRRRVTQAVVGSSRGKDWKQLATSLPALSTLVMERASEESLLHLAGFTRLKRLAVRGRGSLTVDGLRLSQPEQLTHLSLCDVQFSAPPLDGVISAVSACRNLTSLVCHLQGARAEPVQLFDSIIAQLPKLTHLSWSFNAGPGSYAPPGSSGGTRGRTGPSALSSLELVDYVDPSLAVDAMRLMPGLRSLAVFYKHQIRRTVRHDGCHLRTWLNDLRHLSTLVIVKGPPIREYVSSIPVTVTKLTLCVGRLTSEEMAAVAVQVPNLLHLHVDPWPSYMGFNTSQIPQVFPRLKSLKLRHEHAAEEDLLQLHRLKDLRLLEFLDGRLFLPDIINKLQALTNYRLQVVTSHPHRDVLACPCVGHLS